jgi:hypothetical protein
MIVIKNIEEFASIHQTELTSYLERKFSSMVKEYGCSMADIGEVQVLDDLEELFQIYGECTLNSFEVMEIIGEYLHLVQLVDDYYAKDIYVPVNRKEVM